jgi:beta-phosphoglucomutase-like phosphatase (HAD superfamily)
MSIEKDKRYHKEFRPQLRLIKSLDNFLKQSNEKCIKTAIGTAAIIFNIDFLLDGINIRHYFDVLVSADYIKESKPATETWSACASQLGVSSENALSLKIR